MPTSSEARLDSDGPNSKLCCFVTHSSQFTSIYLSIYLSIFLYVLTPEGDIRRVPVNQVLGVSLFFFSFFFFFLVCNVSCVSSEWEKPVLAL